MKIFAHRGASGYAPENTLIAIKKAIEMKADGIEIDIQLTKDGKIVVMHDWKVDRTTTGRGYVYELDYEYIKTLDAGQWFTKDFIGETVPTLEEVLDILPKDMILNIEIKDTARHHTNIEEKMLEVLKKYPDKFENIIVSSFHHNKIKKLQVLEPKLKLALLTDSEFIEIEKYLSINGLSSYSYHPEINLISKEDVEKIINGKNQDFAWLKRHAEKDEVENKIDNTIEGKIGDKILPQNLYGVYFENMFLGIGRVEKGILMPDKVFDVGLQKMEEHSNMK